MYLTLAQQYEIYQSFGLLPMIRANGKVNFCYKTIDNYIGFQYKKMFPADEHKIIKSGFIRITFLMDNGLLTSDEHRKLMIKAHNSSNKDSSVRYRGCISTFDLTEEELRHLIQLHIKLFDSLG